MKKNFITLCLVFSDVTSYGSFIYSKSLPYPGDISGTGVVEGPDFSSDNVNLPVVWTMSAR